MFDQERADRAINFFRKYLRHCTGRWAGQQFQLLPWQIDALTRIYGTIRADGTRQYRRVFIFIPKKNGKSEFAAGIALYGLLADREPGAEVYSAAGDREQAAIVFNTAKNMIQQDRALKRMTKIKASTKRIEVPKTNSYYKVLSAESYTKHGLNIHYGVIDELHVVNRELHQVLTEGAGAARTQPLLLMISTAGNNRNSVCYEEYTYAKQVRDGIIEDDSYLPIIYEKPENMEWDNPEAWAAANPSLGHTITLEGFQDAVRAAKNMPSTIGNFRQLRLNEWISNKSKWLNVEKWDKCAADIRLDQFVGEPCYCSLDLSSTTDLTAFAAMFQRDGIFYLFVKLFCPGENIRLRSIRDKVPYQHWHDKGYITATDGDVIDYAAIREYIKAFSTRHEVRQINVDRWNSSQIVTELQDAGLTVAGFAQGFFSLSTPTKELEVAIIKNSLRHDGNPVMRWMADNAIVKRDPAENIKPDKDKSSDRIDGIVAAIMALDGWLRQGLKPSVYENTELKTV